MSPQPHRIKPNAVLYFIGGKFGSTWRIAVQWAYQLTIITTPMANTNHPHVIEKKRAR
jgi:hypothetical protein